MATNTAAKRPRGVPYFDLGPNGYWYVFWSEGRRSRRESLGTKEAHEAPARFAEWVSNGLATKGELSQPADRTLGDCWTVYETKHLKSDAVVPAGRATAAYAWANLRSHFEALRVPQFDQSAVDDYTAKRMSGRLGRKAKSITVRRELAYLIAAMNFCATSAGGKLIAAGDIEKVKLPDAGQPRDRWLKMDEMQRLLDAAAAGRRGDRLSRVERFLWLALFTAARKQALLDLTWDRVDFETNTIHLNVPGRRVTKKRRADVTIAAQLRPILERAYRERTGNVVLDHAADDIWASMQYVAIRAGFSDQKVGRGESPKSTGITPHVLRHTAATHMARRGVPLWVVAKILGNSLAVCERVYAKWVPENPAGTVDMISGGVLEAAE